MARYRRRPTVKCGELVVLLVLALARLALARGVRVLCVPLEATGAADVLKRSRLRVQAGCGLSTERKTSSRTLPWKRAPRDSLGRKPRVSKASGGSPCAVPGHRRCSRRPSCRSSQSAGRSAPSGRASPAGPTQTRLEGPHRKEVSGVYTGPCQHEGRVSCAAALTVLRGGKGPARPWQPREGRQGGSAVSA